MVTAGAINLAGFVRSTAGRRGTSADIGGGVAVAGPIAVVHGYVDTAIPTDLAVAPAAFVDDAVAYFAAQARGFVLWVPSVAAALLAEVAARGLVPSHTPAPAMVASQPVPTAAPSECRIASTDEAFAVFGDLCERGYQQPGMAALMAHQESYRAPGSYWFVAHDGDEPVSAACAFRTGDTGGIYSVGTPPEFRGRGFAAAVTAAATNHLFDLGVTAVVLQASQLGYGVYERLGFRTYDHFERFTIPAPS